MSRRSAFTRADLLALLTLGTLLAGCLLPALAQGRDADARRASMNNLKQIALAVHNHNDAYRGKLPPLVDVGAGAPTGAGLQSVFFNILPFIEQDNIYRLFAMNKAPALEHTYYQTTAAAPTNAPGVSTHIIKTLISLADTTAPNGTTTTLTVTVMPPPTRGWKARFTGTYATTSYAANGLIPWNTSGIPRAFVDGTSNTIMFAERSQVCKPASGDPVYNLWALGIYAPQMPSFATLVPNSIATADTRQAAPDKIPVNGKTTTPGSAAPVTLKYGRQDATGGQTKPYPFQVAPGGDKACDPQVPQTPHAEGMLVALADGSVRTIKPTISQWTFWAACTPAGNETLMDDWR
jgi:hypothetical protein